MISYQQLSKRCAAIISDRGEVEKLNRIPFMTGSFNEAWLQELLADNPDLIPASEVDNSFSPLVCIGREVPVGSGETQGYIDNLYITPTGNIVIVETKLFRNQESRRTVIAQIIDYAKELQHWDCELLEKVVGDYSFKKFGQAMRLIDIMAIKGYLTFSDEGMLTDNINKNLSSANFLLMIVGDGIRTGVQQLADFLNENTPASFRLALAEIEVYQHKQNTIVVPNLLTKYTSIERLTPYTCVSDGKDSRHKQYVRKPILSRGEFISVFADNGGYDADDIDEFISNLDSINGLSVEIAPTELTVRFCPETGHTYPLLTFSIAQNHSDLWLVPGRIKSNLEKHGVFPFEADEFLDFYKSFVDSNRCKCPPYEIETGFYFAKVDNVLRHSQDFIEAAEQFSLSILQ